MFLSQLAKLIFGSGSTGAGAVVRSNYRGVEVHPGTLGCCGAVREIRGKRFLSDEVPSLPLQGCDAEDCGCTYELFADRRRSSTINRESVEDVAGADSVIDDGRRRENDCAA